MTEIWVIIEYNELGPTQVWAFDSEEKAIEKGIVLLKTRLPGVNHRIGSVEVQ